MNTPADTPRPSLALSPVLIDDVDPVIRTALSTLLRDAGYPVACATNDVDALNYLRGAMVPHVVLLAFLLPVVTSSSLLRRAQDDATLQQHCYLVVTDKNLERLSEEDQRLIGDTCFEVLAHPLDASEVVAAVARAAAHLPATA